MAEEGFTESTFCTSRGDQLYYRAYIPLPSHPIKAVFVYQHGYGAHCGLMHKEYLYLKQAGIACLVYDAVTCGRSEMDPAKRSWVRDMMWLPNDVEAFYQEVVSKRRYSSGRQLPCFLGGQSMGGMVSIMAGILQPDHWQGLVLTAPVLDTMNWLLWVLCHLAALLTFLIPGVRAVAAIPLNHVSRKEAVQDKLKSDPLMDGGAMRVCFAAVFRQSWAWIAQHEHELSLPIWVAFDPAEQVVSPPAIRRLLAGCASKDVTAHETPGYQHEPMLNQESNEVVREMAKWILARS